MRNVMTYFLSGFYAAHYSNVHKSSMIHPWIRIYKTLFPIHFCSIFFDLHTYSLRCKSQYSLMYYETWRVSNVLCKHVTKRKLLKILYFCFRSYVKHIYNKNHKSKDMFSVFLLFILSFYLSSNHSPLFTFLIFPSLW